MSTRTRRATRLASQSLEEKTVVDEVKREHANENIAPDAVESDTRVTSLKDTPKDLQAKPVLHEQDQNQTTNHDNKTPASPPGSPTEPLKRKLGRPLKVVKAEGAEAVTLQQEKTAKNEDEENDTDDKDEDDADDTEDVPEDPEDGEFTLRPKKQRIEQPRMVTPVLVAKEMSEYERMRLENIRKNEEMLLALQLPTMSMKLQADTIEGKQTDKPERDEPKKFAPMAGKQRKPKPPPKNVAPIIPARTSNRLRRLKPASDDESTPASEPAPAQSLRNEDVGDDDNDDDDDNIDQSKLMAADLYFDEETRKNAIRVDGHYTGWINGGVMERYGFEKNATEAWEANGGGTFTFKDPTGGGSGRSRKFNAKDFAKGMFKKNPNAYFYRHNEPGEDQWTGDWTEDERVLFLEVARKFGCGDKWGLFASHIPHRVGYQCSNYYRQVVLPEGLVFDPNYQFTSNGKPIYCGKYNQRR